MISWVLTLYRGFEILSWRAKDVRWERKGGKTPKALAGKEPLEGRWLNGSPTPVLAQEARGLLLGRRPPNWSQPSLLLFRILQGRRTASR
jgi:hypothetical protein